MPLVDGLLLHVAPGVSTIAVTKFVAAFAAAWLSIPSARRKQILAEWETTRRRRTAARRAPLVVPVIRLEAQSIQCAAYGGARRGTTQGLVTENGRALWFLAPFIARLPLRHATALVAHELAHALQWAARHEPKVVLSERAGREEQADILALAWGHSVAALDRWERRNVRKWERGVPMFVRRPRRRRSAAT